VRGDLMLPQRETFMNIDDKGVFYLVAILTILCIIAIVALYFYRWKRLSNKDECRIPLKSKQVIQTLVDILLGIRVFKNNIVSGLMHFLIFWGFLLLLLGTALLSIHEHIVPFIKGNFYIGFSFVLEIAGLMLLTGIIIAIFRRYVERLTRLERRPEDLVLPVWILVVVVTGFFVEAARISQTHPQWERWSFVGWMLAQTLNSEASLRLYPYLWWAHAIMSLGLLLFIPLSKFFHIIGAPISIYLQRLPRETHTEIQDLVFMDACMRCGRCVDICPCTNAGEPYSPRDFVQALMRSQWEESWPHRTLKLLSDSGQKEALLRLWHCTTCGACLEVCPVYGPTFRLVLRQREQAVEEGTLVPELLAQTLERLYKYENPWMASKREKLGWMEEQHKTKLIPQGKKEFELCYFVGCTTSVDARARSIASSFTRILGLCGIDYGLLGDKEPCCGDIAKRVGEVGLFMEKMDACQEIFERYQIDKIVTSSPHCYYTFKTEYTHGTSFNVWHYSIFLHKLLKDKALQFKNSMNLKVTYHDPCYLGRHSRIFDEPRTLITSIPGIKFCEMPHNKEYSLCCGGGGGRMWQGNELNGTERMSEIRAKEAIGTGAEVLVTACPLCLIMMEDAIKSLGHDKKIKVMDLNELVLEAIA